MEDEGVKKEPRAFNRYTGQQRARNIDWVRKYLQRRLDDKERLGHVLDRYSMMALKWLLLIEGIPVDRAAVQWLARKESQKNKRAAKPAVKIPQLLKELQLQ